MTERTRSARDTRPTSSRPIRICDRTQPAFRLSGETANPTLTSIFPIPGTDQCYKVDDGSAAHALGRRSIPSILTLRTGR